MARALRAGPGPALEAPGPLGPLPLPADARNLPALVGKRGTAKKGIQP